MIIMMHFQSGGKLRRAWITLEYGSRLDGMKVIRVMLDVNDDDGFVVSMSGVGRSPFQ